MADQTAYADGFEDAIIGIDDSLTNDVPRVVYSKTLMLEILIADGMDEIDAIEHLEYNVYGAYVGKGTVQCVWRICRQGYAYLHGRHEARRGC
jgi:hypothetical protein